MKKTMQFGLLLSTLAIIGFGSCKKSDPTPAVVSFEKTDSLLVPFSTSGGYVFFRFKDSTVVNNSDSATKNWDFGMRRTDIILNNTVYGPGNAGVILQSTPYLNVSSAPSTGYITDTSTTQHAIPDVNDLWYHYDNLSHSFTALGGKTFIFRTADNFYVKMEMLSADYAPFTGYVPTTLIYKFRYTYQKNGSTTF